MLWLGVAAMLTVRGWMGNFERIDGTGWKVTVLALALLIGGAKGWFVLTKSAARTAGFIFRRPERDWVWNCFHPILWAVIPLMIGMGIWLRHAFAETMPGLIVAVYVGIAAALVVGVRGFYKSVAQQRATS